MTGNHSNFSKMKNSSPTSNNTMPINKYTVDIAGTPMEPIIEENHEKDSKLIPYVQNEPKTVDSKSLTIMPRK